MIVSDGSLDVSGACNDRREEHQRRGMTIHLIKTQVY